MNYTKYEEELISSIVFKNYDKMENLLSIGVIPDLKVRRLNKGDIISLLVMSVLRNDLEAVRILLKYGAYVNIDRALYEAVKNNNVLMTELLLENGAEQDSITMYQAVKNNNIDIVKLLLDYGFDINFGGDDILNLAAEMKSNDILELLLDNPNIDKNQALVFAVEHDQNAEIVKTLLKLGVDPKDLESEEFESPLLNIAAGNHNYKVCELLLEYGVRLPTDWDFNMSLWDSIFDNFEDTYRDGPKQYKEYKTVELFIKYNLGNYEHALMSAVNKERKDVIRLLLEKDKNIDMDIFDNALRAEKESGVVYIPQYIKEFIFKTYLSLVKLNSGKAWAFYYKWAPYMGPKYSENLNDILSQGRMRFPNQKFD
jgi:ankyrin repeat protein